MRFVLLGAGKTGALVAEIAAMRGHTVEIIDERENYKGAALSKAAPRRRRCRHRLHHSRSGDGQH